MGRVRTWLEFCQFSQVQMDRSIMDRPSWAEFEPNTNSTNSTRGRAALGFGWGRGGGWRRWGVRRQKFFYMHVQKQTVYNHTKKLYIITKKLHIRKVCFLGNSSSPVKQWKVTLFGDTIWWWLLIYCSSVAKCFSTTSCKKNLSPIWIQGNQICMTLPSSWRNECWD